MLAGAQLHKALSLEVARTWPGNFSNMAGLVAWFTRNMLRATHDAWTSAA
jgi:hypothetical protein